MRSPHLVLLLSGISAITAAAACGSSSNGSSSARGGDAGSGGPTDSGTESTASDGPFVRADHLPFPQLVYQGGPIMTAPSVVTVTFPGDPDVSTYAQLGQTLTSSTYWNTVRAGYCEPGGTTCVGDGPAGVAVAVPTAPAASYTDFSLKTWIQQQITDGLLPMPDATMPLSNTLYLFYMPISTTITFANGWTSCLQFGGYHDMLRMGSQLVTYAVVDECAPQGAMPPPLLTNTMTASHEIFETASDPNGQTDISNPPAFGFFLDPKDPDTWGWNDVVGSEAGDLCEDPLGLFLDEELTNDGTFTVQRIWSNAFAMAGGDPCNPLKSPDVYFNASPSQSVYVLDVGGSVTFEASAFSTAPMSDWTLAPADFTDPATQYLSFSIQGGTETDAGPLVMVNNGSKPRITVTLLRDPGPSFYGRADGALTSLTGDPANPTAVHLWPFIVVTPADAVDAGLDAAVSNGSRRPRGLHGWMRRGFGGRGEP